MIIYEKLLRKPERREGESEFQRKTKTVYEGIKRTREGKEEKQMKVEKNKKGTIRLCTSDIFKGNKK